MFGIENYEVSWLERCAGDMIKLGPMPKHMAIILDGNRRFARKMKMGSVTEGHKVGSTKLDEVIDMLLYLEVEELTVYVFSVENFKRPKEEVDGIMEILAKRTNLTAEELTKLKRKGVCIEIIGNLDQTPSKNLQTVLYKSMLLSKDHVKLKVKIAFIYTGRNEITMGVNQLLEGVSSDQLHIDQVSETILEDSFTLHPSNPVDILIRTSRECRLSDFLMWKCSEAYLEFVDVTWPEFTFWGLIWTIFGYQNQIMYKGSKKNCTKSLATSDVKSSVDPKGFIDAIRQKRWDQIRSSTSSSGSTHSKSG